MAHDPFDPLDEESFPDGDPSQIRELEEQDREMEQVEPDLDYGGGDYGGNE